MSIFDKIGKVSDKINKANYKINRATSKVGGAIIKGVSAVKAVEAIGPNAVKAVSGVIKTAVNMAGNVERQIKSTELGRRALAGIETLSDNIVGGVINPSNMHIFQDSNLITGLVNLKSPAFHGSVGAFADVADMFDFLQPDEGSIFGSLLGGNTGGGNQEIGVWAFPSAGMEMADVKTSDLVPKYKFQFLVDIQTAPELQGESIAKAQRNFTFLAMEVDRPVFKYTMQEVNSYNFRFSVPTRISFDPVNVTMIDDNANDGMRLIMSTVRSFTPILNNFHKTANIENESGMRFDLQSSYSGKMNNGYLAGVGPVQGADLWMEGQVSDTTTPIASITIYHLYDKSGYVNMYEYINPKISDVEFDKLSMTDTGNQVNEIKFKFVYDWVNVTDSAAAVDHQASIERPISTASLVVDTNIPSGEIASAQGTPTPVDGMFGIQLPDNIPIDVPIPDIGGLAGGIGLKIPENISLPDLTSLPTSPGLIMKDVDWKLPNIAENAGDWLSELEF